MLAEIAQRRKEAPELQPESWWRYPLADGVIVHVRADLAPWGMKRIRKALTEMVEQLKENPDGNERI